VTKPVDNALIAMKKCLSAACIDIVQIADAHAGTSQLVDENELITAAQAHHVTFGL